MASYYSFVKAADAPAQTFMQGGTAWSPAAESGVACSSSASPGGLRRGGGFAVGRPSPPNDAEEAAPSGRGARELDPASSSFYDRAKRLRNRDLRDQIRAQSSVGGILDLVCDRGELWDSVGVSTALHTAAWRCREGGDSIDLASDHRWHHLRQLVMAKLADGEARNLANNIWSLASMICPEWPLISRITAGVARQVAEFKVQEVSNTSWALSTLKWHDEPLFSILAEEMLVKAAHGVNQDLTNTLWAFATVTCKNEAMFTALCELGCGRVAEFKPQELANAVWALATATFSHDALTLRVSRQAIETFAEFRTQNLANFVWAYAKMAYSEEVVVQAVQQEACRKLSRFSAQDLSTVVWALATMSHREDWFIKQCVTSLRERAGSQVLQPQHLSNTLWALATLGYYDVECFKDLTKGAAPQLQAFKAQELSNTVWACASASHKDDTFTDCITQAITDRLQEFDPQGVGNATWAVSMLGTRVRDIYVRVWHRLGESSCLMHCTDKVFSMLVAGFFRCGEEDLAWRLFDRVALNLINPGIAAFGMWWHRCRHRRPDAARELRVLLLMAKLRPCRHLMVTALNEAALRLEDLEDRAGAEELVRRMQDDGAGDTITQLLQQRLAAHANTHSSALLSAFDWRVPPRIRGNPRCDYNKECQVLQYVLSTAQAGDPSSVISSIERFSFDGNGWLKIAGDEKGVVLDDMVTVLSPSPPKIVLEFGCYVGYSATRFSRLVRRHGGRVVSVEVDPIHVCIARSVLDFGGVADVVTVYLGYSMEAIPELRQVCGGLPADVVFMDQRGTRFHIDLQALEAEGMLADKCIVSADNVLKPGAPHFLWHLQSSEQYDLTVVSLREFAAERIEDWIVIARYLPQHDKLDTTKIEFPDSLSELAFRTDRVRQRSCAGSSPGEVAEDDWACHSQEVRRAYAAAGIRPREIHVQHREDGSPFVEW